MSGAQTSTFTNVLYDPLMASRQTSAENQLLIQQQDIGSHELEMGARLAGTLWSAGDTPEARAALYPTMLAQARAAAPGYFKNAPATYPGDAATQALMRLGTPSQTQQEWQANIAANKAYTAATGTPTTAAAPGGGGGGTLSGDTAPINAAGDSRTRKAAEGGPPAAGTPGAQVAQQVHDFWISKGFSEEQTAGIMAGGPGSESDFNPSVYGDKGTSIGLYQHHGPRADGMRAFFNLGPGQMPTADQQNQYAHWEITQGPLKNVGEMLKNAKTPAEAAAIWTQYFGVPADKSEIGRRAAGAQRFVGIYGGQPRAPGSPQAPPGVTMGQVGDQTAPPPPGGAPGAYPAYGGGMGAVIGGQPAAAKATIPAGRPTGPPVVTDQPAGSNVVAGPPGVATVGAPQPPGPAVAGNVDAINAGIVARGGQPVTDPNLTPTPARYAGTAPAPSVEAAPETGWGAGIGSGYGSQNALAPAPVPPAPAQSAQPATTARPPPALSAPAGGPQPPQLQPLNARGLTAQQQAQIDAVAGTGRMTVQQRMTAEQAFVNQNIQLQQKQFSDWIQLQQLQTSQGQLTVAQQNSALEYWKQAHPEAKVTLSGGEIITQNSRTGEEIAPRIKVTPNEAPRTVEGTAVEDNGQWRQPKPGEQGVPGKWTVGPAGGQFFPEATRPAAANFELQKDLHKRDADVLPQYNEQNQQAASNQIRIQQMRELVDQISSGAGGLERANWANIADTMGWHDLAKRLVGMGGAAAAQEFAKYGLATAGAQERGDLGARGSIGAINLYKSANPGLELQPDANKKMLTAQLIAAQANRDYTQGAMDYVNRNGDRFLQGGNYTPLSHFDAEWAAARNPQIYAAAMSAINGDPWQKWTKALNMKSADDVQRVIEIVRRADPTSSVMWKNGEPHDVGTAQ